MARSDNGGPGNRQVIIDVGDGISMLIPDLTTGQPGTKRDQNVKTSPDFLLVTTTIDHDDLATSIAIHIRHRDNQEVRLAWSILVRRMAPSAPAKTHNRFICANTRAPISFKIATKEPVACEESSSTAWDHNRTIRFIHRESVRIGNSNLHTIVNKLQWSRLHCPCPTKTWS